MHEWDITPVEQNSTDLHEITGQAFSLLPVDTKLKKKKPSKLKDTADGRTFFTHYHIQQSSSKHEISIETHGFHTIFTNYDITYFTRDVTDFARDARFNDSI